MTDTPTNDLSESIAKALLWSIDRCQPKPLDEANIKLAAAHIRTQSARIATLEKLVRDAMPLMEKARVEEEFSGRYDMLGIWLSAARDAVGDSASER